MRNAHGGWTNERTFHEFHRYISFQPKDEVLSYREGNQWTVVISRDLKVFIRESEINGKDEEMDVALVKWKYNQ